MFTKEIDTIEKKGRRKISHRIGQLSSEKKHVLCIVKFMGFLLEGHRGVQSLRPENTLASFQKAIDLGVKWVELDLLLTKDGRVVIHHDFDIGGTLVYSMSIEEIKQFDVGIANPDFPEQESVPGARIPELAELFELGDKLCFNLEIKSHPLHPEYSPPLNYLAKKIVEVVHRYGFQNRIYYSSFNLDALAAIREIEPNAMIAYLYVIGFGADWQVPIAKRCQELKVQIVSPEEGLVNAAVMEEFKKAGVKVIPWTVNDPTRYQELVSMGVDGIISDYPQRFL